MKSLSKPLTIGHRGACGSNKKIDNSERASGDGFVHDFTYAELSQLHAIEPWPQRGAHYDGRLRVPLFAEALELARQQSQRRGRQILVHQEAKHPAHFAKLGHDFVSAMLVVMRGFGYESRIAPLFLQVGRTQALAERLAEQALQLATWVLSTHKRFADQKAVDSISPHQRHVFKCANA